MIFLEPTSLYFSHKEWVPDEPERIPLNFTLLRRRGSQLTLLSYGACLHRALQVSEELKGSAPSVLVIDQLGGRYAGLRAEVSGAARFSPGEDTVMFLATIKKGTRYTLQSMGLGKYTVRIDPHTGREVVQQFFPSLDDDYDHRFIPAPRDGQQVFLSDFETTILDRVEIAPTEVK